MKIKTVKSEVEAFHQIKSNDYFLKNNLCDGGIGLVAKYLGGLKNMCLFECQIPSLSKREVMHPGRHPVASSKVKCEC